MSYKTESLLVNDMLTEKLEEPKIHITENFILNFITNTTSAIGSGTFHRQNLHTSTATNKSLIRSLKTKI